jgi:hypothetical protein
VGCLLGSSRNNGALYFSLTKRFTLFIGSLHNYQKVYFLTVVMNRAENAKEGERIITILNISLLLAAICGNISTLTELSKSTHIDSYIIGKANRPCGETSTASGRMKEQKTNRQNDENR